MFLPWFRDDIRYERGGRKFRFKLGIREALIVDVGAARNKCANIPGGRTNGRPPRATAGAICQLTSRHIRCDLARPRVNIARRNLRLSVSRQSFAITTLRRSMSHPCLTGNFKTLYQSF